MQNPVNDLMNEIYSTKTKDEIPWNVETPPQILIEAVEKGIVKPSKCVDLGCGLGNYSIYLATQGFNVTGIDLSQNAIELARINAESKKVQCTFICKDLINDVTGIANDYEFVFEWEVMHHIFKYQREAYLNNVASILKKGAKYIAVHFSINDAAFGGKGSLRKTNIGTELYFSGIDEMKELYTKHFKILLLEERVIEAKRGDHTVIYGIMEKI